jgi:hypothetical protein
LCSGPGFGPSGGACASESAVNPQIRMTATDDRMLIFFSFEVGVPYVARFSVARLTRPDDQIPTSSPAF